MTLRAVPFGDLSVQVGTVRPATVARHGGRGRPDVHARLAHDALSFQRAAVDPRVMTGCGQRLVGDPFPKLPHAPEAAEHPEPQKRASRHQMAVPEHQVRMGISRVTLGAGSVYGGEPGRLPLRQLG